MANTAPIYTIYDLSSHSGVNHWTIRDWITAGVVPKGIGKGICYTESHLRRVNMVRDWRESQITLEELAERIEILGEKALEVPDPYANYDGWDE